MCGRFTLKTPVSNWLSDLFPDWSSDDTEGLLDSLPLEVRQSRYNIAPTQPIVTARLDSNGKLQLEAMRWGLVPFWAESLSAGYTMFNARSESLVDKPSFRPSLIDKRCIVLADGYYEWKKISPKQKIPHWIHRPGEEVFAMAGLWASNHKIAQISQSEKAIHSTTIITTTSNEDTRVVHDRMPVIYTDPRSIGMWLDPQRNKKEDVDELLQLLTPSPTGTLSLRTVSNIVNHVRNDGPELINPSE